MVVEELEGELPLLALPPASGLALALGEALADALGLGEAATADEKLPVRIYAASLVLWFTKALKVPTPREALATSLPPAGTVKVSLNTSVLGTPGTVQA